MFYWICKIQYFPIVTHCYACLQVYAMRAETVDYRSYMDCGPKPRIELHYIMIIVLNFEPIIIILYRESPLRAKAWKSSANLKSTFPQTHVDDQSGFLVTQIPLDIGLTPITYVLLYCKHGFIMELLLLIWKHFRLKTLSNPLSNN